MTHTASRTRNLTAAVAALALVVGLAACGSSSGDAEKSTTTSVKSSGSDDTPTTTSDDSGDDGTSTTEAGATTTVVATGGGEFCETLAAYMNDNTMSDVDPTDPDSFRDAMQQSIDEGKALLSKAPSELDDAVSVLLEAQNKVTDALEKVDYDFSKISPEVLSSMDTPEVQAAEKELDAYVEDTCGIDIPETTVTAATVPEITTPSN